MSTLGNIFRYFFSPLPEPLTPTFFYILLALAVLMVVFSVVFQFIMKKNKEDKFFRKLFRSIPGKFFTIALLLGLYILARSLNMPYISMRFLLYILLAIVVYLIIKYLKVYTREYPQMKEKQAKQAELNKYLPKKKKR